MPFEFPRQWSHSCAKLLEGLNKNDVEYLIIGSLAKALHDPDHDQPYDTDIMIAESVENASRVQQAIVEAYPQDNNEEDRKRAKKLEEPGKKQLSVPQSGPGHEVDILTPGEEFDFKAAQTRAETIIVPKYEMQVPIASKKDLEELDRLRNDAEAR